MSDIEEIEVRGGQGQVLDPETYRDSIGTMEQSGKRKWVFPRKPKGKYTNYRNLVSYALLIIYFSLNLLGGNRGLFAYLDKKDQFENLLKKKLYLTNEITKVKKINSLIGENLDKDYLEILIRDKFVVGKKGENTYIVENE